MFWLVGNIHTELNAELLQH